MAIDDLARFVSKVNQLQAMVLSLEEVPGRKETLEACTDHNQVVALAKEWGYEISSRWGDVPVRPLRFADDNLLSKPIPERGNEEKYLIQSGNDWRLELIKSCEVSSLKDFWYDQEDHEWVVVLQGTARLSFKERKESVELNPGDHLYLAPRRLHRVEHTDAAPGTTWLALFWKEDTKTT